MKIKKEKTTPFGVSLARSLVTYHTGHTQHATDARVLTAHLLGWKIKAHAIISSRVACLAYLHHMHTQLM